MNYIYLIIYILILIILLKFLQKKIKKYKKILKINGLDGVYYYFKNKNFKNDKIENFIDKKKYNLGLEIQKKVKNKILYGPYKGTKIINSFHWSKIDAVSKYLGTYELQIQKKIIELSKKYKLKTFVDIGAAEGFHIISLISKKIFSNGYAYEVEKKSRKILVSNAKVNKVYNKIKFFENANLEKLKKDLNRVDLKKTLFLIDIEGDEFKLLTKSFCNYFSNSFFIIELHEFNIRNKVILKKFNQNIKKKFNLTVIKDEIKNPNNFEILKNLTDDERYLSMSEGRPMIMSWLLLTPK